MRGLAARQLSYRKSRAPRFRRHKNEKQSDSDFLKNTTTHTRARRTDFSIGLEMSDKHPFLHTSILDNEVQDYR
jgi:hypothetical protein